MKYKENKDIYSTIGICKKKTYLSKNAVKIRILLFCARRNKNYLPKRASLIN